MRRADEDDADIEVLAHRRHLASGYREAARLALGFARRYRDEEGAAGGDREKACVAQARAWREAARAAQTGAEADRANDTRPGLARTRPSTEGAQAPAADRKTGSG